MWAPFHADKLGIRNREHLNVHYHLVVPDGVFVIDDTTNELSRAVDQRRLTSVPEISAARRLSLDVVTSGRDRR